jgi:hypothetical protein
MKSILVLSIGLLLGSCAAFRSYDTEQVDRVSREVRKSERVKTYLKFSQINYIKNGVKAPKELSSGDKKELRSTMKKAYKEARIFKFVSKKDADLVINLDLTIDSTNSMGMTILSAASLFLIPSRAIDKLHLKASFTQNGEGLENIEKTETLTTWRQSFLIFALPFKLPGSVKAKTLVDLNRSIITDAYLAGYLKQDPVDAALVNPVLLESEDKYLESMTRLELDDLSIY